MGGHTPSLEEMKQMADKKAAPLLEKLKSDPNNSDLLIQAGIGRRARVRPTQDGVIVTRAAAEFGPGSGTFVGVKVPTDASEGDDVGLLEQARIWAWPM